MKVVRPATRAIGCNQPMISRTFTLWLICICPFDMYAHANVPHVVIARHVIIASDLVILTSCLLAPVDQLCIPSALSSCIVPVSRPRGPLCRRNVSFRAATGRRIASPTDVDSSANIAAVCRSWRRMLRRRTSLISFTGSMERPLPRLGKQCSSVFAVMSASLAVSYHPAASRCCCPRTPDPSMVCVCRSLRVWRVPVGCLVL